MSNGLAMLAVITLGLAGILATVLVPLEYKMIPVVLTFIAIPLAMFKSK